MSQARRERRAFQRLINKIQSTQETKYRFEEVYKEIMDKELKNKEHEVSTTSK